MPKIKQITLRVRHLKKMKEYYQNVLGMSTHNETENNVLLGTATDVLLQLKTSDTFTEPKEPVAGLYHVAYLLPERKDLASFIGHLIDTRAPVDGASDHGISEAMYLTDPEGNGIEVYADRPRDQWPMKDGHIDMFTEALDIADIIKLKTAFNRLPNGTSIGHVHHHSNDIKNHEDYYQKGLGMDLMLQYGMTASFMSYGGYHHHVGFNVWKGRGIKQPLKTDYGLDFVTIHFDEISEIKKIEDQLTSSGYLVVKRDNDLYTEDPSGHGWILTNS